MNVPLRTIRRATLDDLPKLVALWRLEKLPVSELEGRFKEFPVAEAEDGELLGILGVQVLQHQARLHSEVFAQFEFADALREKFWERLKVMGENQGWTAVWTQLPSQTWRQLGFDPPSSEQFTKLPEGFGGGADASWLVLQMREERAPGPSLDAEFQLLKLTHQQENDRLMKRARTLKWISLTVAGGLLAWVIWWGIRLFQLKDHIKH